MAPNHRRRGAVALVLILGLIVAIFSTFERSGGDPADNLLITGLVSNPVELTYGEVEMLPVVWEIAQLQCVDAPSGSFYNWTGVPLLHLLKLADVQPGAEEVVFHAEDGFSSSISIEKAMHPSTILALKVNGTTLPSEDGYWTGGLAGGYPYKVVVPCKWGYKWVGWIDEIEVVDYDYKGFYESRGYSDEADIPGCKGLPETSPAYIAFNATWRHIYEVTVFSNMPLSDAGFNQTVKRIYFTVSSDGNSEGFVYIIVPKLLLTSKFTVIAEGIEIQHDLVQSETSSFVSFTLSSGVYAVEITGMLLSDVTGLVQGASDGKVDMRDIGAIARCYGTKAGDSGYIGKYDINKDGAIDMRDIGIAANDFGKTL